MTGTTAIYCQPASTHAGSSTGKLIGCFRTYKSLLYVLDDQGQSQRQVARRTIPMHPSQIQTSLENVANDYDYRHETSARGLSAPVFHAPWVRSRHDETDLELRGRSNMEFRVFYFKKINDIILLRRHRKRFHVS
jgi:hypothetical protein